MAPVALSSALPRTETEVGDFRGYDHITWYVGNAKQAASFYITRMGFKHIAYRGLETGSRYIASHVVSNGAVKFVLTSPLQKSLAPGSQNIDPEELALLEEIHSHLELHGDAVKDVAFEVDNVKALYSRAVENGATSIRPPKVTKDSKNGHILTAVIKTYGDTTHTLIQRDQYTGTFMPGYRETTTIDPLAAHLPEIQLEAIDHCVGNQDWDQMDAACE
jgi:4-hydroxyphenylpyruvate dioxygenase